LRKIRWAKLRFAEAVRAALYLAPRCNQRFKTCGQLQVVAANCTLRVFWQSQAGRPKIAPNQTQSRYFLTG
jgi:hypothetical protein